MTASPKSLLSARAIKVIKGMGGTEKFFRVSAMQDEMTGSISRLEPSSTQRPVLDLLDNTTDWLIVDKPRQSHISSLCLMWILKEIEYGPGLHGTVIANTQETARMLMARILLALRNQPPEIRVPHRKASALAIEFVHGGTITVASAHMATPKIGASLDRLLASEYGFWKYDILFSLMPAMIKRPHARMVIESTPGSFESPYHLLWNHCMGSGTSDALADSPIKFRPHFIRWWQHAAYEKPVSSDFAPTPEEVKLLRKYEGMTYGHLMFRRTMLASACHGDERLFENQYPYDDVSGWITTGTPALPAEAIRALLPGHADPPYLQGAEPPQPGCKYVITADPAGYGSTGDPSAYTLFNASKHVEVAAWSGRIDPAKFGADLVTMAKRYHDALLVIESNAAAAITAAVSTGYRNLYFNTEKRDHPGYFRSPTAKQRSIVALVDGLNSGSMQIRSRPGLLQLLSFDGKDTRKNGHHFDRVVTYEMMADIFQIMHFPAPPKKQEALPPGFVRADEFLKRKLR